jgi:hypothetical protein
MSEDLSKISDILNELTELKQSVCNSKPESTECSDLEELLKKAQSLVASMNATIELRRILDETVVKTDAQYLNASFQFETRKNELMLKFDSFVTRELKTAAKNIVTKSQQRDEKARGEEDATVLSKAEKYIKDADSVAKTVSKATYLVGAIKFGLRLLLGIPLP